MSLQYPCDMTKPLQKAWEDFYVDYSKSYKIGDEQIRLLKPPFPTENGLRNLLDTAFYTSLRTEEGRILRFRLIYSPLNYLLDHKCELHNGSLTPPLVFDTPRPYSINELIKLSPAIDPIQSAIIIAPSTKESSTDPGSGELSIVGLQPLGSSWLRFVTGAEHGSLCPPYFLIINIYSPGEITTTTMGQTLIQLRNGTIDIPTHQYYYSGLISVHFDRVLQNFVKSHLHLALTDQTMGRNLVYYFDRMLSAILREISNMHHGGCVLFVPSRLKETTQFNYKFKLDSTSMRDALTNIVRAKTNIDRALEQTKNNSVRIPEYTSIQFDFQKIEHSFIDMIRQVLMLSAVDGALVISDDLRILGFGTELKNYAKSKIKSVIVTSNPNEIGKKKLYIDNYGTRHRSAIRFCHLNPEAFAFVISQDGEVRSVSSSPKGVVLCNTLQLYKLNP